MTEPVIAPVVAPVVPPVVPPVVVAPVVPPVVPVVEPVITPPNVVKLPDTPIVTSDFMSSLKPENKTAVEKSGWKSVDAIVESYNALRTEMQNKAFFDLPADATAEQRDAWNKARGRPDTPAEYALTMPTEMPKDMPYDGKFAENFKAWSHEIGLTKAQADALHNKYVGMMAEGFKESGTQTVETVKTAMAELGSAWGEPSSPGYAKNVELATRAMRHLDPGLSDALKSVGLIANDGTVLSAPIAKALANAGAKLYGEDTLYGSSSTVIANPWEKGKENLTAQGEIYKNDPDRAKRLAAAAGVNLKY